MGLDAQQLEQLASQQGVLKATTRDLPWLMATASTGATTVAATMRLAALAGVPLTVFIAAIVMGFDPQHLRY